jgi:hypothetical protein
MPSSSRWRSTCARCSEPTTISEVGGHQQRREPALRAQQHQCTAVGVSGVGPARQQAAALERALDDGADARLEAPASKRSALRRAAAGSNRSAFRLVEVQRAERSGTVPLSKKSPVGSANRVPCRPAPAPAA